MVLKLVLVWIRQKYTNFQSTILYKLSDVKNPTSFSLLQTTQHVSA